ncbi:hypothetical protein BCR43DRAFT_483283 [Syncephalastrum racemosum]|uniref:Uncharacterized protein n=1 Tax=Syncephalastrum racemosum TaxID=13706 RepID=A0A1X2HUX4_SYNRA|nr:hypothetical protein BCR43DRAFT_483283 [Syncephalastrum racemosum]
MKHAADISINMYGKLCYAYALMPMKYSLMACLIRADKSFVCLTWTKSVYCALYYLTLAMMVITSASTSSLVQWVLTWPIFPWK